MGFGPKRPAPKKKPAKAPGGMAARTKAMGTKKAPVRPPTGTKPTGSATAAPAVPAPPGGATAAPAAPVAPATTADPAAIDATTRNLYGHMIWALDEAELGPLLRQAATEGWDEARMKGALFKTNWFKTHGTAKVAASIKEQADAYLVPLSDQARKQWAFKVITGEVQPTEMGDYLKEQAKSQRPWLAGAIDRGITVRQYADPYVQTAAKMLNLAPEAIDFADPKWSRAIDDVREDGTRAPMSLADWQNKLRTDSTYGFDFTPQARTEASQFAAKLQETFGRVG